MPAFAEGPMPACCYRQKKAPAQGLSGGLILTSDHYMIGIASCTRLTNGCG